MNIFVFGSSLTSTYWNGAATYYRGIYKNLHRIGYRITFAEPDVYKRQQNRDVADIKYAEVRLYRSPRDLPQLLKDAAHYDIVVKHSGVGADDEWLEQAVLGCRSPKTRVIFWDVDAPATLARMKHNIDDPFRSLVPEYDAILTYGGGPPIVSEYERFGAKSCVPIYNGLDPETHYPVVADPSLECDMAFVGHRLPDREARVEEFFFTTAQLCRHFSFVLGGEGWGDKTLPPNVRWIGHVGSERHNLVNSSARVVLNINRDSMAKTGFSPPTRVFEAAGAAACVITDAWDGIEEFFKPEREILCASSGQAVAEHLSRLTNERTARIGNAMLTRALRQHTYELRAKEVHAALTELTAGQQKNKKPSQSFSKYDQRSVSTQGA